MRASLSLVTVSLSYRLEQIRTLQNKIRTLLSS
jgi:hypothetical protein